MNIGELFVTLGFKADTVKVKDFAKAIGDLPLDVAAGIAALAGIEYQLTRVAAEALNTAVGFQMFSSQTGLSWKELQRWQIVAEQANVSAEAVASSITALERGMAEIRLGRGNIAPFQMLGIGVNQNAFGVLAQLRERIKGLDRPTATNLISQMGLDPSMIQLLHMTNSEFDRLSKTVAGISGEQEGSFLHAKQNLVQLGLTMRYMGFELVDHLNRGFELLRENLVRFKTVMYAVGIVMAGVAAYFFPITAAIVALILVLDDLAVYFTGGDSVIGSAIEGIKKLGEAFTNNGVVQGLASIGKLMSGAQLIGPIASAVSGATSGGALMGSLANLGKMAAGGGLIGPISAATAAAASVINQTNQINVHSTAPAEDVGRAVKTEIDKGVSRAALQTDNQGY